MVWTTPQTWVAGLVTVDDFNEQIRDNLAFLKDPPTDLHTANEGADWSTTSTSFVDVDSTDLALTITTGGGDVMVHFHGTISKNDTGGVFLDVDVDGARTAGDDGIITNIHAANYRTPMTFTRLIQGLSAGSHTFKLQWRVGSGTVTLYAGAGTSNADLHPQFWVREIS